MLGKRALVALAWLAVSSTPLLADTLACRRLEAEFAAAGKPNRSAQYGKYDRAVTAQREQLDLARRQARNAGCGFSFFGGKTGCGQLNAQIDKMQRNLTSLQKTRAQLASGSARSRSRILADLDANGCRGDRTASRERPQRNRNADRDSIFDQIFGGNERRRDTVDEAHRRILDDDDRVPMAGRNETGIRRILQEDGRLTINGYGERYSTVCVRTCDGYFFPMSPASTTMEFDRDQKNCESTCPGTDVQLYYRPNIGDDADTMVSASTGDAYTSLPTAFQYKTSAKPRARQCGCNPPKDYSVIAGTPPGNYAVIESDPPSDTPQSTETPISRSVVSLPDSGAATPSPDETAPRGLTTEELRHRNMVKPLDGDTSHDVRVVGPTFLPDPAGAIDLRAPDRKSVQ